MAGPDPGYRLVDRYRLVERVGAGGMGEVWRAHDEVLGRTVAVKLMRPELFAEPGFHQRFLVEARAMAGVSHPGVVAIHDYRGDAAGAFLVMEFVPGESLAQLLARRGRFRPNDALDLVARAADAVQAVHDRGIVHRDIKPANLLVRPDGTVLLADFGIARTSTAAGVTGPGGLLGTPSYLAPEQVMGQPATARSDIYALGVVAYECLAGYRPFEAENPFAVAMMRLHEAPRTMVEDVPADVWAVVARALAVDPAQRWASAADLATAARAVHRGWPASPPYGSAPPASPPYGAGPPASPPYGVAAPASPPYGAAPPGSPPYGVAAPASPPYGAAPGSPPYGVAAVGSPSGSAGLPGTTPYPAALFPPPGAGPALSPAIGGRPTGYPTDAPNRARRIGRLAGLAVAVVLVAVVAGVGAWIGTEHFNSSTPPASPATAGPGSHSPGAGVTGTPMPAGYGPCDQYLCPTRPACWGGLVVISGVASKPRAVDCGSDHYWQTFQAIYLPASAADVAQEDLMSRTDIASACSAANLAKRSRDPAGTKGWRRDALPYALDNGVTLLLCLAGSNDGETTGSFS